METCQHCRRGITLTPEGWADPQATGDDAVWRMTCDSHDTFTAEHEPDTLTMWTRPCPCCGQWEYTDESIGGQPRSMNGDRCQECGADNTTPWAVSDEPHPAAWG